MISSHGQGPAQVHVEVAVHKPHICGTKTRVNTIQRKVKGKSTNLHDVPGLSAKKRGLTQPAVGTLILHVPLDGVDEVVLGRVVDGVEVAEPLPDVEPERKVQRVALGARNPGARQHQLHGGVVNLSSTPLAPCATNVLLGGVPA
jgi:hypothetical protein